MMFLSHYNYVHGPLRHLNLGITLSVRSRMVFITTSRGTDAVQLTSNMISSVLKSSRSISILSTTSSGVIAPGELHKGLRLARGLRWRGGHQGGDADHGRRVAGVPRVFPGLPVGFHVFLEHCGPPAVVRRSTRLRGDAMAFEGHGYGVLLAIHGQQHGGIGRRAGLRDGE